MKNIKKFSLFIILILSLLNLISCTTPVNSSRINTYAIYYNNNIDTIKAQGYFIGDSPSLALMGTGPVKKYQFYKY
jgi:hypothetical protein